MVISFIEGALLVLAGWGDAASPRQWPGGSRRDGGVPDPSMYEPVWHGKKTVAAIAEGAALFAAVLLVTVLWRPSASTGPDVRPGAKSHRADRPIR